MTLWRGFAPISEATRLRDLGLNGVCGIVEEWGNFMRESDGSRRKEEWINWMSSWWWEERRARAWVWCEMRLWDEKRRDESLRDKWDENLRGEKIRLSCRAKHVFISFNKTAPCPGLTRGLAQWVDRLGGSCWCGLTDCPFLKAGLRVDLVGRDFFHRGKRVKI